MHAKLSSRPKAADQPLTDSEKLELAQPPGFILTNPEVRYGFEDGRRFARLIFPHLAKLVQQEENKAATGAA